MRQEQMNVQMTVSWFENGRTKIHSEKDGKC